MEPAQYRWRRTETSSLQCVCTTSTSIQRRHMGTHGSCRGWTWRIPPRPAPFTDRLCLAAEDRNNSTLRQVQGRADQPHHHQSSVESIWPYPSTSQWCPRRPKHGQLLWMWWPQVERPPSHHPAGEARRRPQPSCVRAIAESGRSGTPIRCSCSSKRMEAATGYDLRVEVFGDETAPSPFPQITEISLNIL